MKLKRSFITTLISFIYIFSVSAQFENEIECFSILAGKNSNIDNTVLLAHNEDDWGDLLINWYKVPAQDHTSGEIITLQNGAVIPQVSHTFEYLWIEMPGMQFSDCYMNEWGVTVASDQCKSREDKAKIADGGIGFYLRRIMAERAKTAKEAVKIAGELVETLGYNYSGRTYCIADPDEAWMMSVVMGKHWIAQRIPDDEIAVIPNCYTIDKIDLTDTLNFLGSKDIVNYAISRGWYNPGSGKEFSFKYAYSEPGIIDAIWNKPRAMTAINILAKNKISYGSNFPFSFIPKKGVDKRSLMKVLASHLEGTDFESCNKKNPHKNIASRICSPGNQYGFVAELRKGMPKEIANIMWIAVKRPCIQPFMPVYFGLPTIKKAYTHKDWQTALKTHFSKIDWKAETQEKAYWFFKKLADITDMDYFNLTNDLKKHKEITEKELFHNQKIFEDKFKKIYSYNKSYAIKFLDQYESIIFNETLNHTKEEINKLEN
jgi:dipeptidase